MGRPPASHPNGRDADGWENGKFEYDIQDLTELGTEVSFVDLTHHMILEYVVVGMEVLRQDFELRDGSVTTAGCSTSSFETRLAAGAFVPACSLWHIAFIFSAAMSEQR